MLGWMFFDWIRGSKPSAMGACIGAVVGLVAITPAAGFVTIRDSIVIGLVASVDLATSRCICKTKSTLDDTLDVFPCHGVGGIVGMIATGVFAKDVGLIYGETTTFMYHMIALVIVATFSFVGSLILYKLTDLIIPLRVPEDQEYRGPRPQPARRGGLAAQRPAQRRRPREGPGGRGTGRRRLVIPPEVTHTKRPGRSPLRARPFRRCIEVDRDPTRAERTSGLGCVGCSLRRARSRVRSPSFG